MARFVDLTHIYGSRPYPARPADWITDLIVHHSEGRSPISEADAIQAIAEIDAFHRNTRGWPGIAYQRAIWKDVIFLLRPRATYGWHSAGKDLNGNGIGDGNDRGVAVVLLGTHTNTAPDMLTLRTIHELWAWEQQQLGRPLRLSGHRDWWATACPGNWWTGPRQSNGVPTEAPTMTEEDPAMIAELQKRIAATQAELAQVTAERDNLSGICTDLGKQLAYVQELKFRIEHELSIQVATLSAELEKEKAQDDEAAIRLVALRDALKALLEVN